MILVSSLVVAFGVYNDESIVDRDCLLFIVDAEFSSLAGGLNSLWNGVTWFFSEFRDLAAIGGGTCDICDGICTGEGAVTEDFS